MLGEDIPDVIRDHRDTLVAENQDKQPELVCQLDIQRLDGKTNSITHNQQDSALSWISPVAIMIEMII